MLLKLLSPLKLLKLLRLLKLLKFDEAAETVENFETAEGIFSYRPTDMCTYRAAIAAKNIYKPISFEFQIPFSTRSLKKTMRCLKAVFFA